MAEGCRPQRATCKRRAGERFHHDIGARFVPSDRREQSQGLTEKLIFLIVADFANPFDGIAEVRFDLLLEKFEIAGFVGDIAGDL